MFLNDDRPERTRALLAPRIRPQVLLGLLLWSAAAALLLLLSATA